MTIEDFEIHQEASAIATHCGSRTNADMSRECLDKNALSCLVAAIRFTAGPGPYMTDDEVVAAAILLKRNIERVVATARSESA